MRKLLKKLFGKEETKCCGGGCHSDSTQAGQPEETKQPIQQREEFKAPKNYLKRLDQLEEQVNKAPAHASVGGGTYILRGGKRKYVPFKSKQHALDLIAEARRGDITILLG